MICSSAFRNIVPTELRHYVEGQILNRGAQFPSERSADKALLGDLLMMLKMPQLRPEQSDGLRQYSSLCRELLQAPRWKLIANLIRTRERRNEWLAVYVAAMVRNNLRAHEDPTEHSESGPEGTCERELEKRGERFLRESRGSGVTAANRAVDDYVMVMAEMAEGAPTPDIARAVAYRELIEHCLGRRWQDDERELKRLQTVLRPGADSKRAGGDVDAVKGITRLHKESQYVRILPHEWASWQGGDDGRIVTLDRLIRKLVNIVDLTDTHRPEIEHRFLLTIVVHQEPRPGPQRQGRRAEVLGYGLAYNLLVLTALLTQNTGIRADVAWFEHRQGQWDGCLFSLAELEATALWHERWRNVIAVSRLLPDFFVIENAMKARISTRVSRKFRGPPSAHLCNILQGRPYQSAFAVVLTRPDDRMTAVPQETVKLPSWKEAPTTLLVCPEDGQEGYRARFFRDLTGARIAPLPLPHMAEERILDEFANITIGPRKQKHSLMRVGELEKS